MKILDDNTSGISVNLIDQGIDTGPLLFKKKINFVNEKTFVEIYKRLFIEIEGLFVKNIGNDAIDFPSLLMVLINLYRIINYLFFRRFILIVFLFR